MSRLIKEGPSRGDNDFMQEIVEEHNPGPDDPTRPAQHRSGSIPVLWAVVGGGITLIVLAFLLFLAGLFG